jgi:hypothetical protein
VNGRPEPSSNEEVDYDRDEHGDRRGAKSPRLETPLGNGRHRLLIETARIQRPHDPDLRRASIGGDDRFQHDGTLNPVEERLAGADGFDFFD